MTMNSAIVKTDGDDFASIEYGMVLVEFSKDGDSPNCPNSWTYGIWYDGEYLEGTSEEMSFDEAEAEAVEALHFIARQATGALEFLSNARNISGKSQPRLTLADLYGIWSDKK